MPPPVYKAVVELRAENDQSGQERYIIVNDDMNLFQLHRVLQHVFFKKIVQNEKIERMTPEFVYRGEKIKAIRGTSINYLAKDLKQDFLWGKDSLKYACGNQIYTITAQRRSAQKGVSSSGLVNVMCYVPRCVQASEEADLDKINEKLMFTKFLNNHARNKQGHRTPPAVWASAEEDLWAYHLGRMRDPDFFWDSC